jgi:hypothetical protein
MILKSFMEIRQIISVHNNYDEDQVTSVFSEFLELAV